MLPLFGNPNTSIRKEVFIEWERYEVDHDGFGGFQPIRCIYDGRYKLSIHLLSSDELYDFHDDSAEMTNLIDSATHTDSRNALHDRLLHQAAASNGHLPRPTPRATTGKPPMVPGLPQNLAK